MAKVDSIGAGLIPVALAAGVFSGAVFKTSAPPEPPRPGPRTSAATQANDQEPTPRAPRLSELRPVMELLGQSLGVSIEPDESVRAVRALRVDVDRIGGSAEELRSALRRLETFLARRGATSSGALAEDPAQLLDAYLRTEIDPVARLHKLQSKVADRLFDDFSDAEALRKLTASVGNEAPRLDISFLVATVPDYVDSNSGWVADEVLGAIQAAMGKADFLLDRFRLIDWSRADAAHLDGVINDSRLHERQPGALIFRRIGPRPRPWTSRSFSWCSKRRRAAFIVRR